MIAFEARTETKDGKVSRTIVVAESLIFALTTLAEQWQAGTVPDEYLDKLTVTIRPFDQDVVVQK